MEVALTYCCQLTHFDRSVYCVCFHWRGCGFAAWSPGASYYPGCWELFNATPDLSVVTGFSAPGCDMQGEPLWNLVTTSSHRKRAASALAGLCMALRRDLCNLCLRLLHIVPTVQAAVEGGSVACSMPHHTRWQSANSRNMVVSWMLHSLEALLYLQVSASCADEMCAHILSRCVLPGLLYLAYPICCSDRVLSMAMQFSFPPWRPGCN
jgi:hypothetical protein